MFGAVCANGDGKVRFADVRRQRLEDVEEGSEVDREAGASDAVRSGICAPARAVRRYTRTAAGPLGHTSTAVAANTHGICSLRLARCLARRQWTRATLARVRELQAQRLGCAATSAEERWRWRSARADAAREVCSRACATRARSNAFCTQLVQCLKGRSVNGDTQKPRLLKAAAANTQMSALASVRSHVGSRQY
jgi:hypothetical protein